MDERFIEYAMNTFGNTVLRAAVSVTGNRADAEDVFSDVFFTLFKSGAEFASDEHLKAWLIRCALNRAKNIRGSAWNKRKAELTDQIPAPVVEPNYDLNAALEQLEEDDRMVLYLHYYEGYAYGEIASTLKLGESGVRSKAARAREKMKAFLSEDYSL